ncbi:MAG: putative selenate reductase subunit YgfK [Melioribacteraceae bacterium]|nr:putative selenate reductase subunit YgfK [Melioribacteraceae bacterium]
MSDKMGTFSFSGLLNWIIDEYLNSKTTFNIPESKFVKANSDNYNVFNQSIDFPIGPAAGPHTQMAHNIITSYLCGGRFFELKTVQIMDELEIDKPCIYAAEEGYNVEWSQELKLNESYDEYLKAWLLIHLLQEVVSPSDNRGFIFNMSVGYDLKGIKSDPIDSFINNLIDSGSNNLFHKYKNELIEFFENKNFKKFAQILQIEIPKLKSRIENISPIISNSVTLSTMHGCPPKDIESIAKYLIEEKRLHTYVKLNPTLLGFEKVNQILRKHGYDHIELEKESFEHDMQFEDCIPMLGRLVKFSKQHNKIFGIKLSNTLGVSNKGDKLPGGEMYMSGKALFPLTINLAAKIKQHFIEAIPISYSGGASIHNIIDILETGITPVTFATDLLKPGGYLRLAQIAEKIKNHNHNYSSVIDIEKLNQVAVEALENKFYSKELEFKNEINLLKKLPLFDCYIAPCVEACPIHQDVSEYIHFIKNGNFKKATEIILDKNPLPNITGHICDHQCMHNCTRLNYDNPVEIRELKKFAMEKGFDQFINNIKPVNKLLNKKVAIIGAGPSGLAAAYFLAREGLRVTIFEKTEKAGGTVIQTIPEFRIPKDIIEKDIDLIKKTGVEFRFNIDEHFNISKLKEAGYDYIYLAIGAGISQELDLHNNKNVLEAISFLKQFNKKEKIELGKRVAIIGGGNSAMDAARAAKRIDGVEKVTIVYRRTKEYMPADMEEFYNAINEGIIFRDLLQPVKFEDGTLICQEMKLSEVDFDGRRNVNPIPDKLAKLSIDTIITAIGEKVDYNLLDQNNLLSNNYLKINSDTLQTIKPNVFIGGDAKSGPATVVEAIADAKKVSNAIFEQLGINITETEFSISDYQDQIERVKGKVYNNENYDLVEKAKLCLSCNYNCNKCVEVCPNRANILIKSPAGRFKDTHQIIHIDQLCNECGNCTTFCPYNDSPYKSKFTMFNSESEFKNSSNNGFLIQYNEQVIPGSIFLRINNKVETHKFDSDFINTDRKEFLLINEIISNYNYLVKS